MRSYSDMLRGIDDQISPFRNALKSLSENSGMTRHLQDAQRQQDMMRSALGPIEDLRRMGLLESPELAAARDAYLEFQKRFRLPEVEEATRLFRQFEESGAASALRKYEDQAAGFRQTFDAMRAPWLDAQNALRSIGGFVELQRIGLSLRTLPSFDFDLTDRLRVDLGDWRLPIEWPRDIFTDVAARTSFYESRGLDSRLTDFPAAAFEQGAAFAGLSASPPALLELYRPADEGEKDPEEAAFERTNEAHDRLQRFESQLRRFIDERMRAAFGENWIKLRVPGAIRQRWIENKQKAGKAREAE
jgi:hypothetical protein